MISVCWHGDHLCVCVSQGMIFVSCGCEGSWAEGGGAVTGEVDTPQMVLLDSLIGQGSGCGLGHVFLRPGHVTHFLWCSLALFPIPALDLEYQHSGSVPGRELLYWPHLLQILVFFFPLSHPISPLMSRHSCSLSHHSLQLFGWQGLLDVQVPVR